ncbi:MAG: nicotinate-nucleotide adenylyltransferase [Rickettsiales bacterium]|jgi:nicotinate-nucleotide adenylyltransferase|nr:nicotinate-nucleotide adenylyltransferase [Rickettsiales bacterium]
MCRSSHYRPQLPLYPKPRGPIGLLGGSFNPAHAGHLYIAREAQKRLGLQSVWWMVSPQNPLKQTENMASLEERLHTVERLFMRFHVPLSMRVSDMETRWGIRYTHDLVCTLKKRYPETKFVWIMGADNLEQFDRWKHWEQIAEAFPMVVVNRGTFLTSMHALRSKAARKLKPFHLKEAEHKGLPTKKAPAWGFLRIPVHAGSSTAIRAEKS